MPSKVTEKMNELLDQAFIEDEVITCNNVKGTKSNSFLVAFFSKL